MTATTYVPTFEDLRDRIFEIPNQPSVGLLEDPRGINYLAEDYLPATVAAVNAARRIAETEIEAYNATHPDRHMRNPIVARNSNFTPRLVTAVTQAAQEDRFR